MYPYKAHSSNWAKLLFWCHGYVLENAAPALSNTTIAPRLLFFKGKKKKKTCLF